MTARLEIDWRSVQEGLLSDLARAQYRCHVGLLPTRYALCLVAALKSVIDGPKDPLWRVLNAGVGARTTSNDYTPANRKQIERTSYAGPRTEVHWQDDHFRVERAEAAVSRLTDFGNREALGSESGFLQIHLQARRLFEIGELKKVAAALPTDPQILISPSADLSVNVQFNIYELPSE